MVVVVAAAIIVVVVMVTAAQQGVGVAVQQYVILPARGLAYLFKLDVGTAA